MNPPLIHTFRLYMAGDAPNSLKARANLEAFCQKHLPLRHEIQIVNVLKDPAQAAADGVLLTPTLIRLSPAPVRSIIGNLSDAATVLATLGPPQESP